MRKLFFDEKKNNSGFTLVEMIVVIVILGILAAASVASIARYIDLTRFNNNEDNAMTVFQSAQNTVNHIAYSGTSDELAQKILSCGQVSKYDNNNSDPNVNDNIFLEDRAFFDSFPNITPEPNPGYSVHMRFAVTYTPGGSGAGNDLIKDLIFDDLKSTDIFNGLITIEFDVEKTIDDSRDIHYSVNVYSVFYDSRRTEWDTPVAKNGLASAVPYRDADYRRNTSLVGYCNGRTSSSAVDSVYLPADMDIENTFFTLRNGETLDLTWSATANNQPITGRPDHIHYQFSLYDDETNEKFCDLIVNENTILTGAPSESLWTDGFDKKDTFYDKLQFKLSDFHEGYTNNAVIHGTEYPYVDTVETIKNDRGIGVTIYRRTIRTTANVFVNRSNAEFNYSSSSAWTSITQHGNYYTFPLTISYEVHEGDGVSDRISYTLSLDAMMARNVCNFAEKNDSALRTMNYSITRLLPESPNKYIFKLPVNGVPYAKNFYATMKIAPDAFDGHDSYDYHGDLTESEVIYAKRALDDPVYSQPEGAYDYVYDELAVNLERGKEHAVVNSHFGDLRNGSLGQYGRNDAVITSFRHLYNMRLMQNFDGELNYTILRDLNWYSIERDSLGNEKSYSSDVTVYTYGSGGLIPHSPVEPVVGEHYGDVLRVVSFPSIPELNSHATLIAGENTISLLPETEDRTASINNLQLRMPSFYNSTDSTNHGGYDYHGYGIIGENYGTVINIRGNGITASVDDIPDGSLDDRDRMKDAIEQMMNGSTVSTNAGWQGTSPLGALIGNNKGVIGDETGAYSTPNIVRFSNCIVLGGNWEGNKWVIQRLSSCGIIVGDTNRIGSTHRTAAFGTIESTGSFAVAGWINVGGTMGFSQTHLDAFIKVDNTKDTDNSIMELPEGASCFIYGITDSIGGAIGSIKECHIKQLTAPLTHSSDTQGRLMITESQTPFYAVDVVLDQDTRIICEPDGTKKISNDQRQLGVGGAIGRIYDCSGDISIKVSNGATITITDGNAQMMKNVGGAVGILQHSSIENIYVNIVNNGNIGTQNGTDFFGSAQSTGGAIGSIQALRDASGEFVIMAVNNGKILGDCTPAYTDKAAGFGGAIGYITGTGAAKRTFFVSALNNEDIAGKTVTTSDIQGVGGAVGYTEYIPADSAFYCVTAAGHTVHSYGRNAGGCIGANNTGMIVAPTADTTITAALMSGTGIIADSSNAGGCIGNAFGLHHNTRVRTIVNGNVSVNSASNAGGTIGKLGLYADTTGSEIALQSGSADSVLNVKCVYPDKSTPESGNNNAGGLIGEGANRGNNTSEFTPVLTYPSQTGGNILVVNVDSYDNAGGMIGRLAPGRSVRSAMNVTLHPLSHIKAVNDNAGGCIGKSELADNQFLTSNITVTRATTIASTEITDISAGHNGSGGIIGHLNGGKMNPTDLGAGGNYTIDLTGIRITAVNNVGGCIGDASASKAIQISGNISATGAGTVISGTGEHVGGIIGYLNNTTVGGKLTFGTAQAAITGVTCTGGCIGYTNGGTLTATAVVTNASDGSVITGTTDTGGCIGYMNKTPVNASGVISYSCDNASIIGTSHTGGVVGYSIGSNTYMSGQISYSCDNSTITGSSSTGGCIGYVDTLHLNGYVSYEGKNDTITGSSDNTGGLVGMSSAGRCVNASSLLYAAKTSSVIGAGNTGGLIGGVNAGAIDNTASLEYRGVGSVITGTTCTGGLIGSMENASFKANTKAIYNGTYLDDSGTIYTSNITGTDNTGGVIGRMYNANFQDNPAITFNGDRTTITGANNTGGLIGYMLGNIPKNAKLTYSGTSTAINGANNVGGIIGCADGLNLSGTSVVTLFAPVTQCTINGNDNVGGCFGTAEKSPTNVKTTIANRPELKLTDCKLTINGTGYTGGIIGSIQKDTVYSGSNINLSSNSVLNVTSSSSSCGGHIGYMTDMTIGSGSEIKSDLRGSAAFTVTGKDAAGGIIGLNNGKFGAKVTVTVESGSDYTVSATGTEAGAGGLCGINNYRMGRKDSIYLCNGSGNMTVKADNGYAGAILGINGDVFGGINDNFDPGNKINITVRNMNVTSGITALDIVLGKNNADPSKVKYNIVNA